MAESGCASDSPSELHRGRRRSRWTAIAASKPTAVSSSRPGNDVDRDLLGSLLIPRSDLVHPRACNAAAAH